MVVHSNSLGTYGLDAFVVNVEADFSKGIPFFCIVGLPDAAVKESRDRVRAAMVNCGFDFPIGRIIVNLAPADIKKEGPLYDLPILVSLLMTTGQIKDNLDDSVFIGELSLSGQIRGVNGVLPMTIKARECGFKNIYVPKDNCAEAAIVSGINVYPVADLPELYLHLIGKQLIPAATSVEPVKSDNEVYPDFSQVKGQSEAKRALEIAAAGGHNVLLIGPPGSGKSMLAKRVPSILPDMTFDETIETTKIHSVAGIMNNMTSLIRQRPFRSPHHTISSAGLSGGGTIPKPGEISLAHNGVLFLDELPEFSRSTMEALRQPIEDGVVSISRVSGTLTYPCSIMLIAAMNPCPCGYYGHPGRSCSCSPTAVSKYLSRVSGPLLDRFDIHVEVPAVNYDELTAREAEESSEKIKERVNRARAIQNERFKGTSVTCNAKIVSSMMPDTCVLDQGAEKLMRKAFDTMGLSARAYDKVLKLARTIADLEGSENIKVMHIAEAIQYRSLDRKYWKR